MIRRPPRSTLFPLHDALPIYDLVGPAAASEQEAAIRSQARSAEEELVGALLAIAEPIPHEAEVARSEEHTSELQSRQYLVCRLLLEKKKTLTLSTIYTNHNNL